MHLMHAVQMAWEGFRCHNSTSVFHDAGMLYGLGQLRPDVPMSWDQVRQARCWGKSARSTRTPRGTASTTQQSTPTFPILRGGKHEEGVVTRLHSHLVTSLASTHPLLVSFTTTDAIPTLASHQCCAFLVWLIKLTPSIVAIISCTHPSSRRHCWLPHASPPLLIQSLIIGHPLTQTLLRSRCPRPAPGLTSTSLTCLSFDAHWCACLFQVFLLLRSSIISEDPNHEAISGPHAGPAAKTVCLDLAGSNVAACPEHLQRCREQRNMDLDQWRPRTSVRHGRAW